jgi:hypothetical protein
MYIKWVCSTNFAYVLTHVDDLLVTGLGIAFTGFKDFLLNNFHDATTQLGHEFTYLGMAINRNPSEHSVTLNQRSYIHAMLKTFDMVDCTPAAAPSAADLLQGKPDNSPLCDKMYYLSIVMSLMYLARITRPDILFVVSYLATKSAKPTEADLTAVKRVLRYLKGTVNLALRFIGKTILVVIYADASRGVYPEGKGQYSTVVMVGADEVIRTTHKMKCITLSSTESEIVGALDAATYFRWLIRIFQEFRLPIELPIELRQDNLSAMHMIRNGLNFRRAKHMIIKGEFIKELEQNGIAKMLYTETGEMNADAYTKPYTGRQLAKYTGRFFIELEE